MKRLLSCVVMFFCAVSAYAAYSYYYSENLASPNWSNWTNVGATIATYSAGGYSGLTNGRMQYNWTSADSEVKMTLRLGASPSATAHAYLRIQADGNYSVDPPVITQFYNYYDAAVWFNTSQSYAFVSMNKIQAFSQTSLGVVMVGAHDGMVVRAFMKADGTYGIYVDNTLVLTGQNTDISPGKPGVGMDQFTTDGSTGTLISQVDLGPIDTVAPNAIPAANITYSSYTNHVDLQWTAATDDTNGIGIYQYQIVSV